MLTFDIHGNLIPTKYVNIEGILPHNPPDDDDDEEEEEEEEEYDDDNDFTENSSSEEEEEPDIPTPEEVELEYTYPDDFPDRSFDAWRTFIRRFFRLIIDPSCTEIPDHMFHMCTLLVEIVFPNNSCLIRIGQQSFRGCRNLQRINAFPEGMIEFGESAFSECASLGDEITIPRNVRYIRSRCFYYCNSLTSVVFDTDLIEAAVVASNGPVIELGEGIFCCCDELRSVRLPHNVIAIPPFCFQCCLKLTDVPIPVPVRVIGKLAFYGCSSLTSMYFSENVDTIGYCTFGSCTSLKCITIRSSNIRFGSEVFTTCPALSSIKIHPTAWPKLLESMNNKFDPNFIYKFLREYQYQIERLIEWKKNPQMVDMMMPSKSSSSMSALSTQNNDPICKDDRTGENKRPRL